MIRPDDLDPNPDIDRIEVGLIDESWSAKFPNHFQSRLKMILDDPNG